MDAGSLAGWHEGQHEQHGAGKLVQHEPDQGRDAPDREQVHGDADGGGLEQGRVGLRASRSR